MVSPLPAAELDEVLTATAGADWEDLRGARVLLTGGTGFFGIWLASTLAWANRKLGLGLCLHIVARRPERLVELAPHLRGDTSITLVPGDVRSLDVDGPFTHVVHAATPSTPSAAEATVAATVSTIVDGARRLLDIAASAGVRRFLFTSSGAVYGTQPSEMTHVSESYPGAPDPLEPRSAYGEAKRLAELLCAAEARNGVVPATIARCFTFVGPHLPLDAHFAIGNFVRDGLAGRSIVVQGDGSPRRSYLYATDLMTWLLGVLVRGAPGRAYNVGSEREVSIAELARAVGSHFRVPVEIRGVAVPEAKPLRYVPSTQRAREELGLVERVPLDAAIERIARWHS
ncbi:MAG TPA: NAD(P)-dependent oxidoreductase [Polyangiaceae bacterium]